MFKSTSQTLVVAIAALLSLVLTLAAWAWQQHRTLLALLAGSLLLTLVLCLWVTRRMAGRVQASERAQQKALDFDTLTGLPRRQRFIADQTAAQASPGGEGQRRVMVCFCIERLQPINALLGFAAGDQALVQTAQRATALVATATDPAQLGQLARLGGGTFAALLLLQPGETAPQRAQALQVALDQAVPWRTHLLDLDITVGVAASPEQGQKPPELLRRAEQALFEAKRVRSAVMAYNPAMEAARLAHLSLLSELQQALDRHELVPFLQPKFCLHTRRVVGAEALVRWQHPQRGCLLPAEFIPFAEHSGRIRAITRCMLTASVGLLKSELGTLHLAVNISSTDLRDPGFVPHLQQLLEHNGVQPSALLLEVKQSALQDGGEDPLVQLAALRALGVGVAIDNFGTGQSSLAYLQRLPATELKINRSFVAEVDDSSSRQQLLRCIIDMAHSLQLVVTAEGVETEAESAVMQALGCDLLQGYLISKPLPVADFVRLYVNPAVPAATAINSRALTANI